MFHRLVHKKNLRKIMLWQCLEEHCEERIKSEDEC